MSPGLSPNKRGHDTGDSKFEKDLAIFLVVLGLHVMLVAGPAQCPGPGEAPPGSNRCQ